jgi:UDP-N-acetylmuramoyl-tripeptide--D-alanyl-D-alanine ligase
LIFWTLDRVAAALGDGAARRHPRGSAELTGVTTDSRQIQPGQLFVALAGENFDGHDYLQSAVEQGAGAVVVSRAVENVGAPVYQVEDTLAALGQLANYYRRSWGGPVVMVAGSNGKTTTKDLIRAALSNAMKVHATTGNLNNRIGVPLTLLSIPPSCEIAIVEAGTNLPGEVAILRDIMDPDISVVTSIGEEHLEGLGDLDGVLREESAAFEGVRIAIVPSAQPEVGAAARGKAHEVISAGLDEGDVRPESWSITPEGIGTLVFSRTSLFATRCSRSASRIRAE